MCDPRACTRAGPRWGVDGHQVLHVSAKSKAYCAEGRGREAWRAGRPLTDAYPPGLRQVLASARDFEQLEDFNAQKLRKKGSPA